MKSNDDLFLRFKNILILGNIAEPMHPLNRTCNALLGKLAGLFAKPLTSQLKDAIATGEFNAVDPQIQNIGLQAARNTLQSIKLYYENTSPGIQLNKQDLLFLQKLEAQFQNVFSQHVNPEINDLLYKQNDEDSFSFFYEELLKPALPESDNMILECLLLDKFSQFFQLHFTQIIHEKKHAGTRIKYQSYISGTTLEILKKLQEQQDVLKKDVKKISNQLDENKSSPDMRPSPMPYTYEAFGKIIENAGRPDGLNEVIKREYDLYFDYIQPELKDLKLLAKETYKKVSHIETDVVKVKGWVQSHLVLLSLIAFASVTVASVSYIYLKNQSFDSTIKLGSVDNENINFETGEITVRYGKTIRNIPIDKNGVIFLTDIPSEFKNDSASIYFNDNALSKKYSLLSQRIPLKSDEIVDVKVIELPHTDISEIKEDSTIAELKLNEKKIIPPTETTNVISHQQEQAPSHTLLNDLSGKTYYSEMSKDDILSFSGFMGNSIGFTCTKGIYHFSGKLNLKQNTLNAIKSPEIVSGFLTVSEDLKNLRGNIRIQGNYGEVDVQINYFNTTTTPQL